MKFSIKQWVVTTSALIMIGHAHLASADFNSDTEKLLNWAETTYPNYFPNHQITQSIDPWLFRYYPDTKIYAGVNKTNNDVYVLGGQWGDTLSDVVIDVEAEQTSERPENAFGIGCRMAGT